MGRRPHPSPGGPAPWSPPPSEVLGMRSPAAHPELCIFKGLAAQTGGVPGGGAPAFLVASAVVPAGLGALGVGLKAGRIRPPEGL
jgi:hypothetical protein